MTVDVEVPANPWGGGTVNPVTWLHGQLIVSPKKNRELLGFTEELGVC